MQTHLRMSGIAAAAVLAGALALGGAHAADTIKVGAVGPKTGPLAGGAAITHWPNFQLWVKQVNDRGGLKLKSGRAKIELIEYDDRTTPSETINAVQRLATQDKADFIIAPYGTGFNLATAPIFAKYDYPMITATAITDKIAELSKRYPGMFFTIGDTTAFTQSVVDIVKKANSEGKIGRRVAMVNVADAFGIELANAARPNFKKAGLEIVYDKSYPLGTQDLSPVINAAKAAQPDAFVAWSYPPDTFGLVEQAKIQGLNAKVFYTAVATAFPGFGGKFGKSTEGILGAGGINQDAPETQAYLKAHQEVTGKSADFWASAVVYSTLQILERAIEGVGSKDRKAVIDYIKKNTFDTVLGPLKYVNQNNEKFWTVGQWQGGKYYGVASTGRPGAKPIIDKAAW
ncbi:MAG: ABC transporter substrate-binding protein [Rhizobiales bacterium]|nr:ABC transporter substrate-binding protein [Hyphomicrobiales bacterium]